MTVQRVDCDGAYALKSIRMNISPSQPITFKSLTVSPSTSIIAGDTVKVTANATTSSGSLQYQYSYIRYGKETLVSDFTSNTGCDYCFTDGIGPYKIVVTAKNNSGETQCMTKDVWVEQTYIETISADKTDIKAGDTVTLSAELENASSSLTASHFLYTVAKDGKTTVLTTASNKTSVWQPTEKGNYTVTLTLKIGDNTIDALSVNFEVGENPDYLNKTRILVGVISYVENEGNSSKYTVHYWGGSSGIGDAACKSLGTTESKSVGSAYWSGTKQTFHLYEAYIPKDATGYKFHIGDRWFGTDGYTSSANSVYVFNYSGDKCLYEKSE